MIKYAILSLVLFPQVAEAGTLVLVVDMSESIDIVEQQLQMEAYARVLADPSIQGMLIDFDINVIFFADLAYDMYYGDVAGASVFFETFSVPQAVDGFKESQEYSNIGTCISSAFTLILEKEPTLSRPIIVDISGDGVNKCVYEKLKEPSELVSDLFDLDILVNSLPIGESIVAYYEEEITTGFSQPVARFEDFETALYIKLYTEVANALHAQRQFSYN